MGVLLAVSFDRLIPAPHGLDECLVLRICWIKLGEFVALPIGGHVECGRCFLSTYKERTLDDALLVDSIHAGRTENVLAAGLEAVEEATFFAEAVSRRCVSLFITHLSNCTT
jgi:hypothetical protein